MNPKTNQIELAAISGLFVLLSLWGIVWDVTSGLLASGIDGIMLLAICLMMGGVFSLELLLIAHGVGWVKFPGKSAAAPAAPAQAPATTQAPAASAPQTAERTK
ncbi:MAG: hypothetical protein WAR24_12605 [Candidatus Acidiferrales bacterium]